MHWQYLCYDPSPQGNLSAREAIAGYYQKHCRKVDPSAIFLTASTSEAYAYLFKLLADPGDEVLIPCPGYPLFELLAGLESVRTVEYPLKYYNNGWHIDLKTFQRRLINRVEENEQFLRNLFGKTQYVSLLSREGGWYAVAQIKKNVSDEKLVCQLLHEDDVFIHPGYFYDFTTNDYIIISLLPEQGLFQTGINRIYKRLEKA